MLQTLRNQAGFTMAEVLAAMAVAMVTGAVFVKFNNYQMRVVQDQARQLSLQDMARSAIDIFAREVRRAGQNPTCAGGITPVVWAATNSIRIQADVDGNGALAASNEDVTYLCNATNGAFERITNSVADPLITGVTMTGSFRYYDGAGTELVPNPLLTGTQLNNVRRVHLDLSLTKNTTTQNGKTITLKASAATDVDLRNRFFVRAVTCS